MSVSKEQQELIQLLFLDLNDLSDEDLERLFLAKDELWDMLQDFKLIVLNQLRHEKDRRRRRRLAHPDGR